MEHSEQRRDVEIYLSTNEVMRMLGISRSTVYRLIHRGLPFTKVGAINRFPTDQVLAWLEEE
jgi:excisionase family DNA binding protein